MFLPWPPARTGDVGILFLFQVRVWELQPKGHRLLETMKEHKGTVTCIKIKSDDKECVSASSDGACIIWDIVCVTRLNVLTLSAHLILEWMSCYFLIIAQPHQIIALLLISLWRLSISLCRRFVSLKMVITNRLFRTVCYHPDIYQIITSGTDRKVCFYYFSLMTQCTDSHCLHDLSRCVNPTADRLLDMVKTPHHFLTVAGWTAWFFYCVVEPVFTLQVRLLPPPDRLLRGEGTLRLFNAAPWIHLASSKMEKESVTSSGRGGEWERDKDLWIVSVVAFVPSCGCAMRVPARSTICSSWYTGALFDGKKTLSL